MMEFSDGVMYVRGLIDTGRTVYRASGREIAVVYRKGKDVDSRDGIWVSAVDLANKKKVIAYLHASVEKYRKAAFLGAPLIFKRADRGFGERFAFARQDFGFSSRIFKRFEIGLALWVDSQYRQKGLQELSGLGTMLMSSGFAILKELGVLKLYVEPGDNSWKFYDERFGATSPANDVMDKLGHYYRREIQLDPFPIALGMSRRLTSDGRILFLEMNTTTKKEVTLDGGG
jgi:hypothetical protein